MDPPNTSAVTHITGWASSKLEHLECIKQLAAKSKVTLLYSTHAHLSLK